MHFNDSFHDGQTDASPSPLRMKLLEQAENLLGMARIDADAVIADRKHDFSVMNSLADFNSRIGCVLCKSDGVIHQILKDFQQASGIASKAR